MENLKTQKAKKEFIQKIIKDIGLCNSIKNKHPESYKIFLELFKNHPEYPEKIKDITDLKLVILITCIKLI